MKQKMNQTDYLLALKATGKIINDNSIQIVSADLNTSKVRILWGSLGSKTAEEARAFTKKLELAADLADKINSWNVEINYNSKDMTADEMKEEIEGWIDYFTK